MSLDPRTRARRQLLALGALFLVAPGAALLLYFGLPQLIPRHTTNRGQLLSPARPLPPLQLSDARGGGAAGRPFSDHWNLVVAGDGPCLQECRTLLTTLRNLREVLRSDRPRVTVWYVTADEADARTLQPLFDAGPLHVINLRVDHGARGARLADVLTPATPGSVYLIDPLGNWMMRYPPGTPPLDIYEDLKHLLRYSQIG